MHAQTTVLEAIALQAEILDLKANPNRSAEGFVIEAKLERGRGPVGTLLVQREVSPVSKPSANSDCGRGP